MTVFIVLTVIILPTCMAQPPPPNCDFSVQQACFGVACLPLGCQCCAPFGTTGIITCCEPGLACTQGVGCVPTPSPTPAPPPPSPSPPPPAPSPPPNLCDLREDYVLHADPLSARQVAPPSITACANSAQHCAAQCQNFRTAGRRQSCLECCTSCFLDCACTAISKCGKQCPSRPTGVATCKSSSCTPF